MIIINKFHFCCRVKAARKELPYEFDSLVWDENHTRNDRERFCYCGENGDWYRRMLQCQSCLQWFHQVRYMYRVTRRYRTGLG